MVRGHWTPYNPPDPATYPPNAKTYEIKQGDTLSGIARTLYSNAYLWPQLWEANTWITDAHWIYPGDVLLVQGEGANAGVSTTTTTTGTAQPAANPSRNDVVSRYSQAIGNVNAASMNSIELKGTRETAQGNVPLDVMMANGQTRIVAQTPEGEMVNVVGPNGGWVRDPRGTRAMPPVQYAMTRGMLDALRPPMPSEIPQDARVSKDRVGDRDAWVLTYADASNNRHRLFFDAKSGLLIRHLMLNASPIGYIPQQTDFDDYRDVGGFKVPFLVRYDSVDRGAGRSVRYTEIRPNAKIDPTVFDQPKQ